MFVTALNLIPAGQRDGGHISYAWIGEKGSKLLAKIVVVALRVIGIPGFVWPELFWAGWSVWLGPDSNGMFKREYDDGLALSNSQKSLTGFRIIPVIAGGTLDDGHLPSGDWKLINGFQDPAVNDDSIINTTNYPSGYRLNAIDGRFLVRV